MRKLAPYTRFEDARGSLVGIVDSGPWEELNVIETSGGELRGGHYHKETTELFYIVEGEVEVRVEAVDGTNRQVVEVRTGDILIVEPFEVHWFFARTKCRWINALSKRLDPAKPDFHRPSE